MCTRGVYQLRKLSVYFCDYGGSSQGVRDALISPSLNQFIEANPHIEFVFIRKRNHHPYVAGAYLNGYLKNIPLRSITQEEVFDRFNDLRNQLGRRAFKAAGPRVHHPVKSVQGKWMPNMFNTFPRAELEKVPHIERHVLEYKEKEIRDYGGLKQKDAGNVLLGFDDVNAKDHID